MDWETELITLYFLVTQKAEQIFSESMRMSPNATPEFTDAELVTIYLYCTKEGYQKKTQMHKYVKKHLLSWFPKLPSYQAFSYRLNLLESAFRSLSNELLEALPEVDWLYAGRSRESVTDSLPIMLSKGNGCGKAKIALNMADKGFCSTKNVWYHGFKLHLLGWIIPHKMPQPAAITLSAASQHDGAVFFQEIAPLYPNIVVYADKAYDFPQQVRQLKEDYNLELVAIHKRQRGQPAHDAFWNYFNTMVSRVRQPVEAAFNWLIEHTDIQNAAKCRSHKGTLLHIFGKIASALCIYIFFNS
jgi:hypothetical protein